MTETNVSSAISSATASAPEPAKETKDRILDAAESLFIANGFQATSLRRITAMAGVNLAAVNYHFQSKEQLIMAVMMRKLDPVNRQRLTLLDGFEAASGSRPPSLENVLVAFLQPITDHQAAGVDLGSFPVLMGRLYSEPGGLFQKLFSIAFAPVAKRFKDAITRALPGSDPLDILWGMHLTVGAMAHYLARPPVLTLLAGRDAAPAHDPVESLDRLVAYMAGGFRALVSRKADSL
ncbi:MAG: TetR family transcriptional regulator [Bryobacteraceae bacterium]|nr:TetR family transcriptional regulator [Bryobacteraceae bacterium]